MKKYFMLTVITIMSLFAVSSSFAGTTVYRFSDEPFTWHEDWSLTDPWGPGPAAYFDQDVSVDYQALNSETVRVKSNKDGSTDVGWNLIQQGTATIKSVGGDILYVGPFQVEEIGQDDGNDAGCMGSDGQHAWLGQCVGLYTNLDYALYQWKITGNKIYSFKLTVKGPGNYCYDVKGVAIGPGCN